MAMFRAYAASFGEKNFGNGPNVLICEGNSLADAKARLKKEMEPGWMTGSIVADIEVAAEAIELLQDAQNHIPEYISTGAEIRSFLTGVA